MSNNIEDNQLFSTLVNNLKIEKRELITDSRLAAVGAVFISLPMLSLHLTKKEKEEKQIDFIYTVAQRYPFAIVANEDIAEKFSQLYPFYKALIIPVKNERQALGILANTVYNTENISFPIIGITGTNGKTTLSYLLEIFFQSQAKKVGVLGTVSYRYPNFSIDAPLTTPDCLKLHAFFNKMQEAECDVAIMEASSHAIEQERIAGIEFDTAIFTNLTQDHLDYHKNMDDYFQAKAVLFEKAKNKIVNADDIYGLKLLEKYKEALAFSLSKAQISNNTVLGTIIESSPQGLELKLNYKDEEYILKTPLIGQHNASNILALAATIVNMGYALSSLSCLNDFYGVSGRLERVLNTQNIHAFVDYAHTPDALINVLQALRGAGFERIVTVFGCGGDRDRTKRPLMAKAVSDNSDVSIITSDNPRTEDPQKILKDVEDGIDKSKEYYSIIDRKEAILFACDYIKKQEKQDNIVLLIAGKGHETYQIIGSTKYPFSDQEILRGI